MTRLDLDGKVVAITGAGNGLGRAHAVAVMAPPTVARVVTGSTPEELAAGLDPIPSPETGFTWPGVIT